MQLWTAFIPPHTKARITKHEKESKEIENIADSEP